MAVKVSRKYDALVKFLKETVANERMSINTRMSAATKLDSIYARHEEREEKEAIRKERAEARVRKEAGLPDEPEETVEETPEQTPSQLAEERERQQINELLGRVDRA
jgi:hypothetical protein